jgi:nucleoside-diphosphate-sugar epimerase
MTILITGAGGFVGREIVRRLVAQGREVVAMDTVPDGIPPGRAWWRAIWAMRRCARRRWAPGWMR